MGWFNKTNEKTQDRGSNFINPERYAELLARIAERDTDLSSLKSKVAVLQGDVIDLRNKMSKKLRDLQSEQRELQDEKNINDEYLPFG